MALIIKGKPAAQATGGAANDAIKPKKGRSPAYPGIDLRKALELADLVYKQERQHYAAAETVALHWKTKANSSYYFTAVSALRKFGLIEVAPQRSTQSGQVRISDLARDIILDDRDGSEERAAAIKRAALLPSIHANLWRKYNGELPSDQNLRFYLVRDLKFTEGGAVEFIAQFKRTIAFAKLQALDSLSAQEDDNLDGMEASDADRANDPVVRMDGYPQRSPQLTRMAGNLREVPIPIQGAAWPALKAAFPLSEAAWTQMIAVLTAMKPGLVEAPDPAPKDPCKS